MGLGAAILGIMGNVLTKKNKSSSHDQDEYYMISELEKGHQEERIDYQYAYYSVRNLHMSLHLC